MKIMFVSKLLKLCLIAVVIALIDNNCFCDTIASDDGNSTSSTSNTSHTMKDKPYVHRIQMTNGFVMRSLFVVMVISMSVSLVCILRVYCSGKRCKRMKTSKECLNYDSLPTTAINESLPKNAFVLNDSDDEEVSLYDSSHHLIK
ncbi:unnamed protein product [Oppiella nova]|uniref:Uncharacterized protein n=1 Tax=Oppiella nova TaxID=334625 RepID=A0A7R9LUW6_9ACAR|nr:unnamed protein product [Oppiella nova]CAG2166880.1 unnamed protein product [Oppiella nova]